jgi:hypothetical protein
LAITEQPTEQCVQMFWRARLRLADATEREIAECRQGADADTRMLQDGPPVQSATRFG